YAFPNAKLFHNFGSKMLQCTSTGMRGKINTCEYILPGRNDACASIPDKITSSVTKMVVNRLGHGLRDALYLHQIGNRGSGDCFRGSEVVQKCTLARWTDSCN